MRRSPLFIPTFAALAAKRRYSEGVYRGNIGDEMPIGEIGGAKELANQRICTDKARIVANVS